MLNSDTIDQLIPRVNRLKQRDELWEVSMRRARTWIIPERRIPHRPFVIGVLDTHYQAIMRARFYDDLPSLDTLQEEVLQAMLRPEWGRGGARRPALLHVDNAEHAAALAPMLEHVGVRCLSRHSLPGLNRALRKMETGINGGKSPPGLLSLPGVTPPLVGHLFALAVAYYRLAPWNWLSDWHPMEIRYPLDAPPRYAVVTGSRSAFPGLAVYDTLEDVCQVCERDSLEANAPTAPRSWLTLVFDEPMAMSFDDLDAIETYHWPLAHESAYPVIGRVMGSGQIEPPQSADLFWLEGALDAIITHVRRRKHAPLRITEPSNECIPVIPIGGTGHAVLRLPAPLPYIETNLRIFH